MFFTLTILALPLNGPQMFAEGCFTLNRSSPSFSFYSSLPCSNFPSLRSNNISPKDQVEKQFIVYIACMHSVYVHIQGVYLSVYLYAYIEYWRIAPNVA